MFQSTDQSSTLSVSWSRYADSTSEEVLPDYELQETESVFRLIADRWQDWMDVLLGCWLVVSPWQMGYTLNDAATANACGLGVVLIVFNLISAGRLLDKGQEIFNILLGTWLILSPYSLNFATERGPAINAIAEGVMIVALAGWQIYDATKAGKG